MKKYTYREWQIKRCQKLGHDWALQDKNTHMVKVCLRCGATQVFFPPEEKKIWGQTWSDDE